MDKLGGGGLVLAGIVLLSIGLVLHLNLIDWLIDLTGFLFIAVGIVIGIIGLIKVFSGGKSAASDF